MEGVGQGQGAGGRGQGQRRRRGRGARSPRGCAEVGSKSLRMIRGRQRALLPRYGIQWRARVTTGTISHLSPAPKGVTAERDGREQCSDCGHRGVGESGVGRGQRVGVGGEAARWTESKGVGRA